MRKQIRKKITDTLRRKQIPCHLKTALCSCVITWIVLLTGFGLMTVENQAILGGYASDEKLLTVSREEPMQTEWYLLGERYVVSGKLFCDAAEQLSAYAVLIPAPFRLPCLLSVYGEERYREHQKEQRKREFIENI